MRFSALAKMNYLGNCNVDNVDNTTPLEPVQIVGHCTGRARVVRNAMARHVVMHLRLGIQRAQGAGRLEGHPGDRRG